MEITHKTFGSSDPNKEEETINKNDLFQLLELGRITDELKIGEVLFKMRTLSAVELSGIYKTFGDSLGKMEGEDAQKVFVEDNSKYLSLSSAILAHAIESVNNIPMENLIEDIDDDVMVLKKDIISNFQWPVIHALMDFYNEMATRANTDFGTELKK
jgi:hypothetical protein